VARDFGLVSVDFQNEVFFMALVISKNQRMAGVTDDTDFAEWYVEEFMKVHVSDMYYQLSHDGKREMVLNGRRYAIERGFLDPESQAHFITFMWKVGANFFLQPGFREVAEDEDMTPEAKVDAFYNMDQDQAVHAIMNPDERYWYPELLREPDEDEA
jgi:hypothetical protein